jgi:mevalonate kinase
VDTGKASQTKPLVQHFREQMKQDLFAGKFLKQYSPLVEQAVHQWKNGELEEMTMFALSEAQLEFLAAMIPDGVRKIWHEGIFSRLYALKLCGSGGGGMMLGFTDNPDATEICLREKFGIRIQLIQD